jgi:hypothetical protein
MRLRRVVVACAAGLWMLVPMLLLQAPATVGALPNDCVGPLAPIEGHTITGNVPNTLILTGGSWTITNATVGGAVIVGANTSLFVDNSVIGGAINAGPGASVLVCAATVDGAINARSTPAGVTVCASTVKGPINVTGSTQLVLIGDLFGGAFCGSNHLEAGANNLIGNTGGVDVTGNAVNGTLNFNNNRAVPYQQGLSGSLTISGNVFGGSLNCSGNVPPPSDNSNQNIVKGARTGQCTGPF